MKKTTFRHFKGVEGIEPYVSTYNLTDEQQKAIEAILRPPMPTDKMYENAHKCGAGLEISAFGGEWVSIVSRWAREIGTSVQLDSRQTRQLAADLVEFADAIDARS